MYAEVNLQLDRRQGVLAVPVTAVDGDQVTVVTRENRIEKRRVQLGLETAAKVEVRSGLKAGDLVVVGSRSGLEAGQEVRPKITTM
jgi:HlyD family secretion protein/macrolide-specific efflux system membrane fusion protein